MKYFCCYCCEIFSACLSVHVLHLLCFPSFSHISFFLPPLSPVFPSLLPGNLLPLCPLYIKLFLQQADIKWSTLTLCTLSVKQQEYFYLQIHMKNAHVEQSGSARSYAHMLWVMCRQHKYRRMLQGRRETWPQAIFIDGRGFTGDTLFSWTIT